MHISQIVRVMYLSIVYTRHLPNSYGIKCSTKSLSLKVPLGGEQQVLQPSVELGSSLLYELADMQKSALFVWEYTISERPSELVPSEVVPSELENESSLEDDWVKDRLMLKLGTFLSILPFALL